MAMRPLLMLPEMLTFAGGLLVLMAGSFVPRQRQWVTRGVASAALVTAAGAACAGLTAGSQLVYSGTFAVDGPTGIVRVTACLASVAVLAIAGDELAGSARESETCALVLFSVTGVLVLGGAADLLVLMVGFLLASIPLYALIGLARGPAAAEATMKTYLLGALFGIVLMVGVVVLSALAGGTAYADLAGVLAGTPAAPVALGTVAVLGGLMFKAGGVPAHFWIPDAAQAAGGAVAAFVTTVPKVGALVAAYRFVLVLPDGSGWPVLVAVLATAGMTLGNLAAYAQTDPRRLLGWSTVSQVGFLLVPVAVAGRSDLALPALLFYLLGYAATNIAAFAVTAALPARRDLASYRGLAGSRPWLAGSLVVALLGLVGTPPTAVFVGKLTTATAAWEGGMAWLAAVVVANTLLSLFYYLRWIIPAYRPGEGPDRVSTGSFSPGRWSAATAVTAALVSLLLGVAAGGLWPVLGAGLAR